jgi:hypothetical protein
MQLALFPSPHLWIAPLNFLMSAHYLIAKQLTDDRAMPKHISNKRRRGFRERKEFHFLAQT